MSHWTGFEDWTLRLLLLHQVSAIIFISQDTTVNSSSLQRITLRSYFMINRNLHPWRSKNRGFCVVISVSASFERLLAIHRLRCKGYPTLVLGDHSDHSCLVNISYFNLVPYSGIKYLEKLTWILHESEVFRDLSLVNCVFQCILCEDLMSSLEILLFIFRCLEHFLSNQFASPFDSLSLW